MAEPFSHRSSEFESVLKRVKDKLTSLTDANTFNSFKGQVRLRTTLLQHS